MHATNTTQSQQVNFLTCFDQNDIAFSDEWATSGQMPPPNVSALTCVNKTGSGLDYKAVEACGNGQLGTKLQTDALEYFTKTFPMFVTGGRFDVPHVYINSVEQEINLPGNVWSWMKTLCDINSEASACNALSTNGSSQQELNKYSARIATV